MRKTALFSLAIFVLFLSTVTAPAVRQVEVGMTKDDVIEIWGTPSGFLDADGREVLIYEDGRRVELDDGLVRLTVGETPRTHTASETPSLAQRLFGKDNTQPSPPPPTPSPETAGTPTPSPSADISEFPKWAQFAHNMAMKNAERQAEAQEQWERGEYPLWKIILPAVLSLLLSIEMLLATWIVFQKAGQPGWAIFVPIYNAVVFFRAADKPGWWILLMFLPFVNFIVVIVAYVSLARMFGKGIFFGLGLLLFPYIFFPILAHGKAEYGTLD